MLKIVFNSIRSGTLAAGALASLNAVSISAPLAPISKSAVAVSTTIPVGSDFNIGIGIGLPLFGGGYFPGYYGGGFYGGFPGYYGGYYRQPIYDGYYRPRYYGSYYRDYYPPRYYGRYYRQRYYGPVRYEGRYYPREYVYRPGHDIGGGITCTPRMADAGRC
jgi:hypothetical protein